MLSEKLEFNNNGEESITSENSQIGKIRYEGSSRPPNKKYIIWNRILI